MSSGIATVAATAGMAAPLSLRANPMAMSTANDANPCRSTGDRS